MFACRVPKLKFTLKLGSAVSVASLFLSVNSSFHLENVLYHLSTQFFGCDVFIMKLYHLLLISKWAQPFLRTTKFFTIHSCWFVSFQCILHLYWLLGFGNKLNMYLLTNQKYSKSRKTQQHLKSSWLPFGGRWLTAYLSKAKIAAKGFFIEIILIYYPSSQLYTLQAVTKNT